MSKRQVYTAVYYYILTFYFQLFGVCKGVDTTFKIGGGGRGYSKNEIEPRPLSRGQRSSADCGSTMLFKYTPGFRNLLLLHVHKDRTDRLPMSGVANAYVWTIQLMFMLFIATGFILYDHEMNSYCSKVRGLKPPKSPLPPIYTLGLKLV